MGLYDVKTVSALAEAAAAGFDIVHTYENTQTLESAEAYLVDAANEGLLVSQNMPAGRLSRFKAKPWFMEVISTLWVSKSFTGWFAP